MSFLKYPKKGNYQERNNAIDNIANASDENSLVDAWVDFFSWYPSLWGPNGDSAKKALHSTLSNVVKHKDALDNALGMLDDFYGKTDGIPPKDPTPPTPPRRDPLVLDSDKDGFISTVALEDSNTYFDITGDGIKERVGWIESNDGILVYDKNNNGNIDGVDEVFGNATTSGFSELKQIADSNNDNKIDRKDELYSRLQVWHDNNGNGTVEQGELKSLKDEDIKTIELDVVGTNINVDGNLLTEAGRYQDTQGNRELAADGEWYKYTDNQGNKELAADNADAERYYHNNLNSEKVHVNNIYIRSDERKVI
jgi:hypothetical protein